MQPATLRHCKTVGLFVNPNGIASLSPGLLGTSYPGLDVVSPLNPERVSSRALLKHTLRGMLLVALASSIALAADPLPSWNDTGPKKAIITFVEKVTNDGSPDFVPVAERIATFDND